jgi:geranylgeranyl diphosphate synthase type I
MVLSDLTQRYVPLITDHLQHFFEEQNAVAYPHDLFYSEIVKKLAIFTQKGKKIRGSTVLMAYELNGGTINDKVLNAAAGIELIHAALLIHDDIMDNDRLRRGEKTVVGQYEEVVDKHTHYFPQSMAICVGDAALFLANILLNKISESNLLQSKIVATCMHEFALVCSSQMMDVYFSQPNQMPSLEQVFYIYAHKTGRYTFTIPLFVGEALAAQDPAYTSPLESAGEKLGTVFQMKDDEIGLLGSEKEIGKLIGSDIRENKKTIFSLLLYSSVNDEEKIFLDNCFGNPAFSENDMQKMHYLIHKYAILEKVNQFIAKLCKEINTDIEKAPINEEYRLAIKELVNFNLQRKK